MNLLLTASAVLPAIILCVYVFRKDRVEKEPLGLLLLLFFLGALSCFPAATVETVLLTVVDKLFKPFGYVNSGGALVLSETMFYIYNFVKYFFVVALVEEAFKFLILYFVTKKSNDFNCLFDGMIYAIFVSLGFAALENIFYVLEYGFSNALMRAVLSVPAHMFFAVMMGYYYTFWHIDEKAINMERKLKQTFPTDTNVVAFAPSSSRYKTLLVPVLAHGLYDFCCTAGTGLSFFVFIIFVIYMYVNCFKKIKNLSLADGYSNLYAKGILIMKYPELEEYIKDEL